MADSNPSHEISGAERLYDRIVLGHPVALLILILAVTGFFVYHIKDFKMDASSDSIVLENDADLRYYSETRKTFVSDDSIFITVSPPEGLFTDASLERIGALCADLEEMESVESVLSILTVPLYHSPNIGLLQLATGYNTLAKEGVDRALAKKELTESPLYRDLLISRDGTTSTIQVTFKVNKDLQRLEFERFGLRDKRRDGTLTAEEARDLERVERDYKALHTSNSARRRKDIGAIREIMKSHAELGAMYIGGVPMVVADIIRYVEHDIIVFGVSVLVFILIMMVIIFRTLNGIVLPTLTCLLTVLIMMGYLGFAGWRTTIVTSNFSSLLLIITTAMAIHIVVRNRELQARHPDLAKRELMLRTVRYVAKPCLYTSLTTIVGFGSLYVSRMRPVMDFALMMALGITVAYGFCFVFLPALGMVLPKGKAPPARLAQLASHSPLTAIAHFTDRHRWLVALTSLVLFALCLVGTARLKVENRFIDYFKQSTPIYRGMTYIDNHLGGTTPLELILTGDHEDYWLEKENLDKLREIHQWLDALPETGKVLSVDTLIRILESIMANDPLMKRSRINKKFLQFIRGLIPKEIARDVLTPYVNDNFDQTRITIRVRESSRDLNRKQLLAKIDDYLRTESPVGIENARVTGMFVLYNNMLQSLFRSQIQTIVAVIAAIWLMFLILFRSASLATIAIIPNILPVVLVLGALGWIGIPLDMMTIMIAAITMGIAVDDTIHYIHRFRDEFKVDGDYIAAMHRSHNSIGRAMYYTSVTIIAGFSVLMLSNFIPTIYFGLFTGLAMIVALLAAITLLPLLLITWKPLGPDQSKARDLA